MSHNKLDSLLELAKNEKIDSVSIDFKTRCLIQNVVHPRHYVSHKFGMMTALGLFTVISLFGSFNLYNHQQEQLAIAEMEEQYSNIMDVDYLYDTMHASYQPQNYEE